jgi:hypothetical protein
MEDVMKINLNRNDLATKSTSGLAELHKRSAEASGLDPRRGWSKTHE